LIQVHNLVKKYGSHRAVDDLSFAVGKGELFGLLGPNGAGKTTTISVLATLLPGDGGSASIGGFDVADQSDDVRRLIGIVPQEIALYPDLNARDNLNFWGRLYGLKGAALVSRVDELLEMADLTAQAGQKVDGYSGGMKRRLNLAVGLVHAPEVLFLDEPTVGIDAHARSKILTLIGDLAAGGLTVIYTTHYLEEAEQLCDRIGVIDQGRLVALGDKEDLIRQIGDEDCIRFQLAEDRIATLEAASSRWQGFIKIGRHKGKVEIRAADGASILPELQGWFAGQGLVIEQLEIDRPNLEALYLNLTGHGLREKVSE
jgi:ABC-2 type transport system ATP-binding protein